jgi:hypothetical protein
MAKRTIKISDVEIEIECAGLGTDGYPKTTATIRKPSLPAKSFPSYQFSEFFGAQSPPLVMAAAEACVDELTGTTAAERAAARNAKNAELKDYCDSTARIERAMNY